MSGSNSNIPIQKGNRIIELFIKKEYGKAVKYILNMLNVYPKDWWLTMQLAAAYYELYDYEKAKYYCLEALEKGGTKPLVLWYLAGTLDALKEHEGAIIIYKELIQRGEKRIAREQPGSILFGRRIVNDSYFRSAIAYRNMGKDKLASRYFMKHLQNRKRGLFSLYSKKEVLHAMQNK